MAGIAEAGKLPLESLYLFAQNVMLGIADPGNSRQNIATQGSILARQIQHRNFHRDSSTGALHAKKLKEILTLTGIATDEVF